MKEKDVNDLSDDELLSILRSRWRSTALFYVLSIIVGMVTGISSVVMGVIIIQEHPYIGNLFVMALLFIPITRIIPLSVYPTKEDCIVVRKLHNSHINMNYLLE